MSKSAEITILGCGGSGGVPLATNYWGNCNPNNPKNRRTRASIAVRTERTCVVIDTGTDFHAQTVRENINEIDAVFYTHSHSDHVNGMDDLRYCAIKQRIMGNEGYKIPVYMDELTSIDLHQRFPYLFRESVDGLYIPLFDEHRLIDYSPNIIDDLVIDNFVQTHGIGRSIGYRFGDVTYSTDLSGLDSMAMDAIKGTRIWIMDCGQYGADEVTVHANYQKILEWKSIIQPEKIYLTHLTPRNDYDTINAETLDDIECAYDGLKILANI